MINGDHKSLSSLTFHGNSRKTTIITVITTIITAITTIITTIVTVVTTIIMAITTIIMAITTIVTVITTIITVITTIMSQISQFRWHICNKYRQYMKDLLVDGNPLQWRLEPPLTDQQF